jgi:hypothetical protein
MKPREPRPRQFLPNSPFNRREEPLPPAPVYAMDDRVTHDRYGLGRVIALEGTTSVVVDFGTETRRINLPTAKLAVL